MKDVIKFGDEDFKFVLNVLDEHDANTVLNLKEELIDNWKKKQIFRTEVEMRVSVLNDAHHPTDSSKYWQAVREMSVMFDSLIHLSFSLRRQEVKKEKLQKKLKKAIDSQNDLKVKSLQIDIEENLYEYANMKQVASDRIRELNLWSKIKNELDNGSFDTQDVNEHQYESYKKYWDNRVDSLNQYSPPADIMNALGPKLSIIRLTNETTGKFKSFEEVKNFSSLKNDNLENS